jgi:hypothetical protein
VIARSASLSLSVAVAAIEETNRAVERATSEIEATVEECGLERSPPEATPPG